MTNFRPFQTERVCRRRFQIWWKWQWVLWTGRNHCWKRRNCSLQAISPFPTVFSKDFYSRDVKTRTNICFKPFSNKPLFLCVCITSLLKTLCEKNKLLVTSNFSFSHSFFYPFGKLSAIFIKIAIVICKLFQFRRCLNFVNDSEWDC